MAKTKPDTRTQKQRLRTIRQEELREQLSKQGHLLYAVECIDKIRDVSGKNSNMEKMEFDRLKVAAELHLKLVNKYLGDTKQVEFNGEMNHINEEDTDSITRRLEEIIECSSRPAGRSPNTH